MIVNHAGRTAALGELSEFRQEFYRYLRQRADACFVLAEAVLCADGPVGSLVGLSLAAEHRRGHGALYDAVNNGRIEVGRLRRVLAGLPLPRDRAGRIVLAADVSPWLRPDAACCPDRAFCHVRGRGRNAAQLVPGYDITRLAWPLQDLPIDVLGRLRSDRNFYLPAPTRRPDQVGRPARPSPARVRRGFRHPRGMLALPARVPKPTRPGPGRPPGSRNKQVAARPPVGKSQHQNPTPGPNNLQKV